MSWILWVLLSIVTAAVYVDVVILTHKYVDEKTGDEVADFLASVFWPVALPFIFIVLPLAKLMLIPKKLPGLYSAWRERRRVKKTAKLLDAHRIDPLQEELRELFETRRQRQEKELELAELKRRECELEAAQERHYREPAIVP